MKPDTEIQPTMALVYRYLGFVEHDECLPHKVTLDLFFFLNEFCGSASIILKKALQWAQKQNGWMDDRMMAEIFYKNYLRVGNKSEHLKTAFICMDVLPNFKHYLGDFVHEEMREMLADYYDRRMNRKLLASARLVGVLYSIGTTSATEIFELFTDIVDNECMENPRRIETFEAILETAATRMFLIEIDVDQRFLSSLRLMKGRSQSQWMKEAMTPQEIDELIRALIKLDFLTEEALRYDKFEKTVEIITSWCKGKCTLKQAVAKFAALDFKYEEQLIYCAHQFILHAMKDDISHQDKLVNLQMHLRNDTYKNQMALFDTAWNCLLSRVFETYKQNTNLLENAELVRYISGLYMHNVIDCSLIVESLNYYVEKPSFVNDPCFTAMYTTVEEKLKTDINKSEMQAYADHLVKKIIAGREKSPNLPPACEQWLAKKDKERRAKTEKVPEVPKVVLNPCDLEKAVENYCEGTRSLAQLVEDFEKMKPFPTEALSKIVMDILNLAMTGTETHKKLAALLKTLKNETLKHRARELSNILFTLLKSFMDDFFDDTVSPVTYERNMCFVGLLNQLFVEDVIDEELIVESLDTFLDDWDDTNDACFSAMFARLHLKLRPRISEQKYQEFVEHLEGYIIVNQMCEPSGMPLECQQYLSSKFESQAQEGKSPKVKENAPQELPDTQNVEQKVLTAVPGKIDAALTKNEQNKVETPSKKPSHVSRKVQRMTINMRELESAEKLSEVVVNLQKVLDSKSRMTAFIKHILERPKSNLKEILQHAKLLVALAGASNDDFEFRSCLASTMHSEYLLTNAVANFNIKARAKLNQIEVISGELWRNNLMATKKFAGLLLSKNIRYLPTESLAHLSLIVSGKMQSEGNSRLKLAVRTFEPLIHESIMEDFSDMKDDLEDLETELALLLSSKKEENDTPLD